MKIIPSYQVIGIIRYPKVERNSFNTGNIAKYEYLESIRNESATMGNRTLDLRIVIPTLYQ